MADSWMIDVLADLSSFAERNGYVVLADQLADTMLIAAVELASPSESRTSGGRSDARGLADHATADTERDNV
ncbi:MAG: hypothetical protein ABNH26_01565 [Celeribacter sp.]|jgi:hypothetical protein